MYAKQILLCQLFINNQEEMICIDSLHISLNRFLLLVVGLWPYQQSNFVRIQLIFINGIFVSFILCQFTVFITSKCTPDLIINVLSSAFYCTIVAIQYISFMVNMKNIKYILEQLLCIHNEIIDENEINIIGKYSNYAKRYTITLMLIVVFTVSAFTLYVFWPYISNILFSTNEFDQLYSIPLMTEYFIDKEKYFYFIWLHTNGALLTAGVVLIATTSILIVFLKYACGMFQIACYRFERAMTFKTLRKNKWEIENLIYKELICAIDMHRKAMKLCNALVSKFQLLFSVIILFGVIGTSLILFRMISFGYDTAELSLYLVFAIIIFIYALIGNYLAQEITDHNNNIFTTIYTVQWYVAPLHIQKMILFLLQRGTKAFTMNIAGLFVGSLEGAATLFSTAISYFTVLYSTRN